MDEGGRIVDAVAFLVDFDDFNSFVSVFCKAPVNLFSVLVNDYSWRRVERSLHEKLLYCKREMCRGNVHLTGKDQ